MFIGVSRIHSVQHRLQKPEECSFPGFVWPEYDDDRQV